MSTTTKLDADTTTALERVLDYLWDAEAAHYRDDCANRGGHIFESLVVIRRWLDAEALSVAGSNQGGTEDE